MTLLSPVSDAGYLKAGILGFAGTGKTHTAIELAIGVREFFRLDGPLAMYDTETGSRYWRARVEERTGKPLLAMESRNMPDLMAVGKEAIELGASVLLVDSISHVWQEIQESYLRDLQEAQRKAQRRPSTRLEFQDWNAIKSKWSVWPDFFLNAPLHIIVCGRAGHEYDYEENDRGKRELVKTGIKMKAEAQFGYEPSLVIEMYREMDAESHRLAVFARVIKDRFDLLNGQDFPMPTFETFRPHVAKLRPAAHVPVDTALKSTHYVNEGGRNPEREEREVLAERVQHEMVKRWPGQSAADKASKALALERNFGTGSWKELTERLPMDTLRRGLASLAEEPLAREETH